MAEQSTDNQSIPLKILDGILLILTLILSVIAFMATLRTVIAMGQFLVVPHVEGELRQFYTLGTIRNFWMFCGGIALLAYLVGGFDYFSKRLGGDNTRFILLRIVAVEIVLIVIGIVV